MPWHFGLYTLEIILIAKFLGTNDDDIRETVVRTNALNHPENMLLRAVTKTIEESSRLKFLKQIRGPGIKFGSGTNLKNMTIDIALTFSLNDPFDLCCKANTQ